jgi:type 1 glutamine amidotransferase
MERNKGMRKALIVWGGWDGHQPKEVAEVFRGILAGEGFEVEVSDTLDVFKDEGKLRGLHLIVPIWTMGEISREQANPVYAAVRDGGVGIAGCHGGMCDSFRKSTEWQFMTGGQWVAHPGNDGVRYLVKIVDRGHEITRGLGDFEVCSEQYYMHVDPAVKVLATTRFPTTGADGPHVTNGEVEMPQVWTKMYGKGRVFYSALGHQANVFEVMEAKEMMRRGFLWAARGT